MKRTGERHAAGSVSLTACSMSSRSRNRPGSAGTSFCLSSARQTGCAKSPVGEVLEIEIPAGRPRIFRVDVQVGVEAHRMPRVSIARAEAIVD
jgi:hypothetical protein